MLNKLKDYSYYAKELLALAMPMMMGSIGIILIGAGDVFVAAKYSTDALASISLANSITSIIFVFGIGLLVSVSPILSNVRGQKKSAKKYFYPTIRFAMVSALIATLLIWSVIPLIDHFGFEAKLVPNMKEFIFIIAFSTFGGYLHAALKEFLQAYEIVFFPNLMTVCGIFLNLLLNFIFVFGWGIIPPLGVKGLAISSLLVRIIMGAAVLIYCLYNFNMVNHKPKGYYKDMLRVGLPISFAILIEFLAINGMTILMGRVSGIYAAAQNIINIITNTAYMIPMAIANAIAVKVGFANGEKNILNLKNYSIVGIFICVVFMLLCGILYAIFPRQLAGIFTNDTKLIATIAPVMVLVGLFQVFDGLQVSLGGIAKGIKKTKAIFSSNLIGYWVVGFPIGAFMAFEFQMYLVGFWIGFVTAPIVISLVLIYVLLKEYRRIRERWKLTENAECRVEDCLSELRL